MDALVYEHPGGVRAYLAGGVEIPEQSARNCIIDLRILEHDERRLAAELERHLLESRGGIGHDGPAGTDLPGERDLADVGVLRQQPSGGSEALDDLEDSLRQSRFAVDFGELDRGERRE